MLLRTGACDCQKYGLGPNFRCGHVHKDVRRFSY